MLVPSLGGGRASGEGNGNPLQYSFLENSMDRGSWCAYSRWGLKESDMIEVTQHARVHLTSVPQQYFCVKCPADSPISLNSTKMRYSETDKGFWSPCTRLRSLEHKSHLFQWASSCPHLMSHRFRTQSTELRPITQQRPASHLFHTWQ